jgi:hypothetical protein
MKIRLPWQKPDRMQSVLVSTEDGRIVDEALPVELGYLISEKQCEAYALCPSIMVPQRGTRKSYVVIDERDALPQPINKQAEKSRKEREGQINTIAHEHRKQAMNTITEELKKRKFQEMLMVLVVGSGFLIVALMAISYIASGKLQGG